MRVGMVVRRGRSGGYMYSVRLSEELRKNGVRVEFLTEGCNTHARGRGFLLAPLKLAVEARSRGLDLVHVQFEYSTFGSPLQSHLVLLALLLLLRVLRVPALVTLHGVLPAWSKIFPNPVLRLLSRLALQAYYILVSRLSRLVIVLNNLQSRVLEAYGVRRGWEVVPHGSGGCSCKKEAASGPLLVSYHGFMRPSKGLIELIEAVDLLRASGLEVVLVIHAPLAHQASYRRDEVEYAREVVKRSAGRAVVRIKPLSKEELEEVLCRSSVIVLPYQDWYVESSGVLHTLMGCTRPVVVSARPRFLADVRPWEDVVMTEPSPRGIAWAIRLLARDQSLRTRLSESLSRRREERSWGRVARLHKGLYLRLGRA